MNDYDTSSRRRLSTLGRSVFTHGVSSGSSGAAGSPFIPLALGARALSPSAMPSYPTSPLLKLTRASASGAFLIGEAPPSSASASARPRPPPTHSFDAAAFVLDVRFAKSQLVISDDGVNYDRTDEHRVFTFELHGARCAGREAMQTVTFRYSGLRSLHFDAITAAFAEDGLPLPSFPAKHALFDMAKKRANVEQRGCALAKYLSAVLNARETTGMKHFVTHRAVHAALGLSDAVCELLVRAVYLSQHGLPVEAREILESLEQSAADVVDAWLARGCRGVLRFPRATSLALQSWDARGAAHLWCESKLLVSLLPADATGRSFQLVRAADNAPLVHFATDGVAWTLHRASSNDGGAGGAGAGEGWQHLATAHVAADGAIVARPHGVRGAWTPTGSAFVVRDAGRGVLGALDARGREATVAISAGSDALLTIATGLVGVLLTGES